MLKNSYKLLGLIVLVGLALRLFGIMHAFPFIFHPDEPTVVRSALDMRWHINPGHFDWPHLYIYLNYFLYMIFAKIRDIIVLVGLKEFFIFKLPIIFNDEIIFYLLTRIFTAVLGALTAIPVFLSARNISNTKTGLLAATALSITPFHVWHSHYSLIDVPMMFFLAWSVYFTTLLLFKVEYKNYLLAGLFLGLAASTKYNAALFAVCILLAHFIKTTFEKSQKFLSVESFENLFIAGFFSILGFVIGTPFAVLDRETFLISDNAKGALWQFTNVGRLDFTQQLKSFAENLFISLPENFGYTLMYLFILSIVGLVYYGIKNKGFSQHKDLLFYVLSSLFLVFYIAGSEKTRAHYFFVAYPTILITGIFFISNILQTIKFKYKNLLWLIIFAVPLYYSVLSSLTFYNEDTRILLNKWLQGKKLSTPVLYYTDNDLAVILKQDGINSSKVENSFFGITPNSYLILTQKVKNNLKLVEEFDNNLRKGPNIYIYSL